MRAAQLYAEQLVAIYGLGFNLRTKLSAIKLDTKHEDV